MGKLKIKLILCVQFCLTLFGTVLASDFTIRKLYF